MTLQISLPPETEAKLRERAAAAGQEIEAFVEEAVAEKLAAPDAREQNLSPSERAARFAEWARSIGDVVKKNVPPGHVADDSRESIYEDSAE